MACECSTTSLRAQRSKLATSSIDPRSRSLNSGRTSRSKLGRSLLPVASTALLASRYYSVGTQRARTRSQGPKTSPVPSSASTKPRLERPFVSAKAEVACSSSTWRTRSVVPLTTRRSPPCSSRRSPSSERARPSDGTRRPPTLRRGAGDAREARSTRLQSRRSPRARH
jgi:hypothetical protein